MLIALLLVIYLVPILIALAALALIWLLYRESRRDETPFPVGMAVGLGVTALVCGGFGVWLWASTIDNSRHSREVPEVSALTIAEAQDELRAAGFTDVRVDIGGPTVGVNLALCEVSNTDPGQFLDADDRDPVTIKGWCRDGARTAPSTPTAAPPTPTSPASAPATSIAAFCTTLIDYFNSPEMDEVQVQASSDDVLARMEAFGDLLPRAESLVAAIPAGTPYDARRALIEHARNVESVKETGYMSSDRPFLRSKPLIAFTREAC